MRLEDAQEVLRAIRFGEVDAVVVEGPRGDQLFTLKGADEPYRVLIEEMNQGAVTLSSDGAILFCNRRFAAMLKRPMKAIIGFAFHLFVAPGDRAAFGLMLETAATGASSGEIVLHTLEEAPVPVQLALSPLPADSAAALCLVATDISESKQVEAELKSREANLSEAQRLAYIGSWELDILTNKVNWSDELYRIYYLNRADFLPNPESYVHQVHPEDRERVEQEVQKALQEKRSFNHDHRIIRADGTQGVVQARGRMVFDEAGKPLKFVGTNQDITERKQVEAELEEANRLLREASRKAGMAEIATNVLHNVGNVLNSVNVSVTIASSKIRQSRSSSVTNLANLLEQHSGDLPAFLTSVQGLKLPKFLSKLARQLAEEQRAVLDELQLLGGHVDHIKEIVAMQQSYTRTAPVIEALSPAGLVEDAVRINASGLDRHGVNVIREYEETPLVQVDKHKLLQILVNLISNAKYAMDDPGAQGKRMTLRIGCNGGSLIKISVCDEGAGIPAENMARIFEHGFTTREGGHGFGLHSAALAAKQLGGALDACSAGPGKGALFTLELPLANSPC
ncbi:MAG: sensor signal transduction histidine kinase [Chthoniobacteraceae bacterium]|nr:sensor signal transduction histidine kinase [Chthoniobacteraceae bacterium]